MIIDYSTSLQANEVPRDRVIPFPYSTVYSLHHPLGYSIYVLVLYSVYCTVGREGARRAPMSSTLGEFSGFRGFIWKIYSPFDYFRRRNGKRMVTGQQNRNE